MHRLLELASKPQTIHRDASVQEAALRMGTTHAGSLVVTREGRPCGLVTDRDIALAALPRKAGYADLTVAECASEPLLVIPANSTTSYAARSMKRLGIRRLGLEDETGELVGVVSFDDLLRHVTSHLAAVGRAVGREFEQERAPFVPRTSIFGSE